MDKEQKLTRSYVDACVFLKQALLGGDLEVFTIAVKRAIKARWGAEAKILIDEEWPLG